MKTPLGPGERVWLAALAVVYVVAGVSLTILFVRYGINS
jgi:hypothetical protein